MPFLRTCDVGLGDNRCPPPMSRDRVKHDISIPPVHHSSKFCTQMYAVFGACVLKVGHVGFAAHLHMLPHAAKLSRGGKRSGNPVEHSEISVLQSVGTGKGSLRSEEHT